jgi:hypothetical protein
MVSIFRRFVTVATSARAALWSMQGTKNEWPLRNLDQSILYITVSIFIGAQYSFYLQELVIGGVKLQYTNSGRYNLHAFRHALIGSLKKNL